jgi:hypothetical protein
VRITKDENLPIRRSNTYVKKKIIKYRKMFGEENPKGELHKMNIVCALLENKKTT